MRAPIQTREFALAARLTIWCGVTFAVSPLALAHEGPPFPILMDQPLAGCVVSVWADPDIGEATFFIVVEQPSGGPPDTPPGVTMWFEPVSRRLPRTECETRRQRLRNQLQFVARPYFDQRDQWTVGFRLTANRGDSEELVAQVESTPPGFGVWDFAIYLFPFVLLGGMWVLAMVRRNRMLQDQTQAESCVKQAAEEDNQVNAQREHST